MRKQNIDLLYDLVKEEYKSKPFNFNAVYKALIKDIKLSKKEQETEIGSLYTDLLQDKRFVYIGDKQWMLREDLTLEEMKKYENALYGFEELRDETATKTKKIDLASDEEEIEEEKQIDEEEDEENNGSASNQKYSDEDKEEE